MGAAELVEALAQPASRAPPVKGGRAGELRIHSDNRCRERLPISTDTILPFAN